MSQYAFPAAGEVDDADLIEETLIEEVSIDGMCGVY
ncbi:MULTISPECIES: mycofactocin precursor MftA [Nocardia]|uniref:Mycofactocin n=1 Tax=Nocardia arthritidis TaxID=228602 RepID=A0A6G9YRU2_9NOCA|nr:MULTISPECIES: mycofactocin precursor MftA [Nocardia]QIS15944.1 mycofactocin precursor [Nocardia arthritidis]